MWTRSIIGAVSRRRSSFGASCHRADKGNQQDRPHPQTVGGEIGAHRRAGLPGMVRAGARATASAGPAPSGAGSSTSSRSRTKARLKSRRSMSTRRGWRNDDARRPARPTPPVRGGALGVQPSGAAATCRRVTHYDPIVAATATVRRSGPSLPATWRSPPAVPGHQPEGESAGPTASGRCRA